MRRLAPIFALLLLSGCAFAQNSSGIQAGAAVTNGAAIIPNGGCRFLNQSLPAGSNASPYDVNLLTADCVQPTVFSLSSGSFPGWATLNPATGEISGLAATGTNTFILQVRDGEGVTALSTQLVISITGAAWPAQLDAFTLSGCTSVACEPHGTNTLCVGTPVSAAALPGGVCASSFSGNTSGLQAALNSLPAAACGTVVNIQNITGYTQVTIPSGIFCGPPNLANPLWDWITGDLSDTTPPEGQRVSPCWIGIPQTAMPYYLYPTGDALCSSPARHMPRIMANALNGAAPIALAIPSNSNVAATGVRLQLVETTRDGTADIIANGGVDLSYNPGIFVQTAGLPCSLNPLTGGRNALPVNALNCYNVQPSYITVSQIVDHGDAQRQTIRGFEFGGSRQTVLQDSYLYDFNSTYAGGSGDSQAIHGGGGHGYSGQGDWVIKNDFLASSTQGVGLFCGNYAEPITPTTLKDGIPKYVRWTQLMSQKNAFWNPERGLTLNDTENIEGLNVLPAPSDQELVVNAPLQLQQGQTFQLQTLLLNDTGSGVNRMTDAAGAGSVTIDGVAYTTVNSANGIITKNGEHQVGTAPYISNNQVSWTYIVCSGAGVPNAACTGPTTVGTHVIHLTSIAIDARFGAGWGGNRTLSATVNISVLSGAPTHQIVLSPDPGHAPDLELQPSYSDGSGNTRNFSAIFQEFANFTPGALTWSVCDANGLNCVVGGNASVGTINAALTGLPSGAALYTSGTAIARHSIKVSDGTTVSNLPLIDVTTQATILAYDFKAATSKNLFELKCIDTGQVDNSLFQLSYGGNGNGGGQKGDPFLVQTINQGYPTAGQTQDGSGNNTNNIGPEHANDFNGFNLHFLHAGGGFIINPLATQSLGVRNIALSNVLVEDANPYKWTNGWLKNQFDVFAQITGATGSTVVPWSSASFPALFNLSFNHVAYVGGTSTTGNGSLLSIGHNVAQFPMTGFTLTNSIIVSPGLTTFSDANGVAQPCMTASGSGANNTEARALAGANSLKPCFAPGYVFNNDAFVDLTALPSVFTSAPIYQPTDADADLFPYYNGGNGGIYSVVRGGRYDTNGSRAGSDNLPLGMSDPEAIYQSDVAARWGSSSPLTITTPSTLPAATHSVAYSQSLSITGGTAPYSVSIGGPIPPGAEDIFDYAMMPVNTRSTSHLSATGLYKAYRLTAGVFFWIKNSQGYPSDIEAYDGKNVYQWGTEMDSSQDATCIAEGWTSCFSDPQAYKLYDNPVALWPRYHVPGADDVTYTPGPNKYKPTTNCGADNQAEIDNLGVRGELTGPFTDITWQTTYGGNIPDNTPYWLGQKWLKCTANNILNCTTEEDYYLVKGYGQARWCPKSLSGGVYVTGTCTTQTTVSVGGAPTPNFACTLPNPSISLLPNGVQRTSGLPMALNDSTGAISGTFNAGSSNFTVQVEDANGRKVQKLMNIPVN
jgi:hypothetical protein